MTRALLGIAMLAAAGAAQDMGSVEGTVVNAVDGRPIAGVVVVLQGAEDSYIAQTGRDGKYRVEGVAPGKYEAHPQRDGFTAQPPGLNPARAFARFQVEAGQRAAVVSRLVALGAIAGRVVDGDGDAVPMARIEALRYTYNNGKKELASAAWAPSDDRGEFRVFGLPPGRYYLRASKQFGLGLSSLYLKVRGAKAVTAYTPSYFPGTGDPLKAVPLDLAAGGDLGGANIQILAAATYTVRAKLGGSQAPSPQARLSIGPISGGMSFSVGGGLRSGSTIPYPNATPGSYVVEARDDSQGLFARQIVEVVNADVEVTLTLAPEVVLSGAVRVEGGTALAPGGVRISLEVDRQPGAETASPGADGAFRIRRLQPIRYGVRVSAPAGAYLKSIRLGEAVPAIPEIDMARASGPLTVTLATDGGRLDGVVVDASGAPCEGAALVLAPMGALRDWADLVRAGVSGKDGAFELRDIAPGEYRLFAWDDAEPGAGMDPEFRQPFAEQSMAVRVAANGRQNLQVRAQSLFPRR